MTQEAPHRLQGEPWQRALLWGAATLPPAVKRATMPLWAAIPFFAIPKVRRHIARNLERVLGPAPKAVGALRAYRLLLSFAQSLADAYAAHGDAHLPHTVEIEGGHHLAAARALGRGIVLATGHMGLWQLGPYLLDRAGYSPIVLAMAREADGRAQRFEERVALKGRFRVVYSDGGLAALELLTTLRQGGIVAVQMDRAVGSACARVPFLGSPAPFAAGPAALARATGAPLLPVFLLARGPGHVCIQVGEPIAIDPARSREHAVTAATSAFARTYEAVVRAHPFQWFNCFDDVWRKDQEQDQYQEQESCDRSS